VNNMEFLLRRRERDGDCGYDCEKPTAGDSARREGVCCCWREDGRRGVWLPPSTVEATYTGFGSGTTVE